MFSMPAFFFAAGMMTSSSFLQTQLRHRCIPPWYAWRMSNLIRNLEWCYYISPCLDTELGAKLSWSHQNPQPMKWIWCVDWRFGWLTECGHGYFRWQRCVHPNWRRGDTRGRRHAWCLVIFTHKHTHLDWYDFPPPWEAVFSFPAMIEFSEDEWRCSGPR